MILTSLVENYERLVAEKLVPAFGSTQEKIGFCILLSRDGRIVDVSNLRDLDDKKAKWSMLTVPSSFKRSGISPPSFFLWDKSAFSLGLEIKAGETEPAVKVKSHAAFKALHKTRLADSVDDGLVALRLFLEQWKPEEWALCEPIRRHAPDIFNANVVFRLDGETQYLHDRPAARELVEQYSETEDAAIGQCLVTGKIGPVARVHPAIKGVPKAQTSGASIVSFQPSASKSYGKEQGANAPVSVYAAFAYTTVLNHLLMRDAKHDQCVQVADTSVVFWAHAKDFEAQKAAEEMVSDTLDPQPTTDGQEVSKIGRLINALEKGRPLSDINPKLEKDTRMYVLGLAPNASRLSVRYWITDSLDRLMRHLVQHYQDLSIRPVPWKNEPGLWRILTAIAAREEKENIPPQLAGAVMRAVLSGGRYPQTLLSAALIRMRADGHITGLRVAICKAVLTRDLRLDPKNNMEVPVSLDIKNSSTGYLLGRLFAILENIQTIALGNVNASITDRYFASASVAPQQVFHILVKLSEKHIARARKTSNKKLVFFLEDEMGEIICRLEKNFPKSLSIEDQSWFVIGYYQQRYSRDGSKFSITETADINDEAPETTE